jgi:1-acyl-sn-glycerol-3-phosphate acyltransferase
MSILRRLLGGGDRSIERATRPQSLADSFEEPPLEGIDWLRRVPGPEAPLVYRILIRLACWFLFGLARLRLQTDGQELLPDGGYIAVCALHRSWVDPMIVIRALPLEPRVWFMGSGATLFDRGWKERLLRHTGGLLPVWRGGTDIDVHVRSASAVVDAGGVLALFAEGRVGGPPDAPARLRSGAALLCLRTGAPIVPIAMCGAEQLYRGKRVRARIMRPLTAAQLLGSDWQGPTAVGSRAEMQQARLLTEAIDAQLRPALEVMYPETVDPTSAPRRWQWLTRLLR